MSGKRGRKTSYLRQRFPKRMQKKLVALFVTIVLAFVGLVGEVTRINAKNGEKYTKIVLDQQQYNSRVIPFKRGDILDRNGTVIATSERVYNVILDCYVMMSAKKEEDRQAKIDHVKIALQESFEIAPDAIDKVIENDPSDRYEILKRKVSYEQAVTYKETYGDLDCIWLEEDYIRYYPYDALASDLIGFTVSGNVGNAGIEAAYNSILNGTDGREYGYLDADATFERTVKEAVNGYTVVSTIDITLQSIIEKHIRAFNEEHKNEVRPGEGSKNTAVIIMNPNTGEILAEASYPNFDLNNPRDLTAYYSQEEIAAMTSQEELDALNQIWRNFCVSDAFEPGSTVKPFTVAAGLECGTLKGGETYNCTGSVTVVEGTKPVSCNKRVGHGTQNLSDGIANSCNVVMMRIVGAMGKEEFCKYQSVFGFGAETGIDLPGEAAGLLYDYESMRPLDLATNSFGQNFTVTMTQMVAATASLINGGNYYKPHVVKQIQDENGNVIENKDSLLLKKTVSEETSQMLRKYMKQTMTEGTGRNAQVEGYSIGAKTGTAEKLPRGEGTHILSYMGFAPAENPEVLVYVVIDEANVKDQDTSKYVTDLSREIMAEAFPYLGIPMDPNYVPKESVEQVETPVETPEETPEQTTETE